MTKVSKLLFLIFCLNLICTFGYSQIKGVGLPFIVNHQRSSYQASNQNWAATQSDRGFMYFGNNDGILEFDGTNWHVYPVPNASIVRSIMAVGDTIYAGAFEQIGYLAPDAYGKLAWHSLNHLVPQQFSDYDEVWNLYYDSGRIIFHSFTTIMILEEEQLQIIRAADRFGFMHQVNGNIYVVDSEQGLMLLQGDSLNLLSTHPVFLNNEITCMLPFEKGSLLVGTANEGVFVWDDMGMNPWGGNVNQNLKEHTLFSGLRLNDGSYAFGSIANGLYITDSEGQLLQHINRLKGLQNNTILALHQDHRNNLWMCLDNGIDYAEISSPITMLDHNFNIESVYASIVHNGIVYVGTNQGLFAMRQEEVTNKTGSQERFTLIDGTEGQVWSLQIIDNALLCGHNYGCFQIDGFTARQVSDIRGFWSFLKPPDTGGLLIAGTYTGLVKLERKANNWYFLEEVSGFRESSRSLYLENQNQQLWVSHGYKGLFRLDMNDDYSRVLHVRMYQNEAGLPQQLPYNIQQINGKMYISTHQGILYLDHVSGQFEPDPEMNAMFADKGFIDKIYQDSGKNLWYYTNNYLGVMRLLEDGTFRDITAPFSRINGMLMPAFQNIFVRDAYTVFIGSQSGLAHYNPAIINDYSSPEQVSLTEVSFYGKQDAITFSFHSPEILYNQERSPQIAFGRNAVTFRFSSPAFEDPDATRFSNRLKGFDESWSEWDVSNFKEYTNLREGNYVFEVKSMNAFGVESDITAFQFTVSPPLFRSRAAFIIYAIILLSVITGNIYFMRKRILRIRLREKIRHEKRLARREQIFKEQSDLSEKEIMHLRNESLHSEMLHKNKELANATLHLIQKNKTLNDLKTDLNKLLKSTPADKPEKQQVISLLKKVKRDLRNEKNWELFNSYFDEVHQDFISRLKKQYKDLSPRELRLCAYLRMNLTTKEIAPLMNISFRGVEISRYRLRKKLKLDHNTNLTEFIISF